MTRNLAALLVAGFLCAATGAAPVLYVDDDAGNAGNGLSWAAPYTHLRDALAAAEVRGSGVTEIRVAQGTYRPDTDETHPLGTGNRALSFDLVHEVALRGGYAGMNAPDPDARDVPLYPTVLSGDLLGDDLPGFVNIADNSYHVVSATFYEAEATLDGFTVRGGNSSNGDGGGLWIFFATPFGPVVTNCTFEWNSAYNDGGGIYSDSVMTTITDCVFVNNHAGVRGGGLIVYSGSAAVSGCQFSSNTSSQQGGGALVGATTGLGLVTVQQCTFAQNQATERGGGLYIAGTGQPLTVESCAFIGNSAVNGGGAYANGGVPTFSHCLFEGNTTVLDGAGFLFNYEANAINCIVRNNVAGRNGGGGVLATDSCLLVNCLFSDNSAVQYGGGTAGGGNFEVVECTFSRNGAGFEGGGMSIGGPAATHLVTNSVFWDNTDNSKETESGQIATVFGGAVSVNYCDLQGWTGSLGGIGNVGADPLFVDADGSDDTPGTEDDNFRIQAGSPCIDAGDGTAVPPVIVLDLGGNLRYVNDPDTPDTGIPSGENPIVDMGAYEFQGSCPWDQDGNGSVGITDFLALLAAWGPTPGGSPADFDGDGVVGIIDFLALLSHWGPCA